MLLNASVSDLGAFVYLEWTAADEDSQKPGLLLQSVSWRSALGHHRRWEDRIL